MRSEEIIKRLVAVRDAIVATDGFRQGGHEEADFDGVKVGYYTDRTNRDYFVIKHQDVEVTVRVLKTGSFALEFGTGKAFDDFYWGSWLESLERVVFRSVVNINGEKFALVKIEGKKVVE